MSYDADLFAEKFRLAVETAQKEQPEGGLCGSEIEWNLLDSHFGPLLTAGSPPDQQSFVDYLRDECLPEWSLPYSQLEVFHWMIEWATRPYYSPRAAVYEARLMEAVLLNALHKAGRRFGERLYKWHGNLLFPTRVGPESIPGNWNLAKRRYLECCVELYGSDLATAGTHTNLSLPDPLLAWDFMHLPDGARGGRGSPVQFDEFKSEFYITATRLLRAYSALFIATSASTPLAAELRDGEPVVVITEIDSVRNLTFPNPPALDRPDLYRSYSDYLQISYDLVRSGVRFGNNNWTPTRARSFAEPVERMILVTSEQLSDLYARGLYSAGQASAVEEMAHQIEIQNLLARINLPMARVEIRTDDGGNPLEIEIANLTLKHLLLARCYADPEFSRAFRYDGEDIARARRNESRAAHRGLQAEVEDPLTGKPSDMRQFLRWTLDELRPLAEALELWEDLSPLVEMAEGGPNTAERLREELRAELEGDEVPLEMLTALAEKREQAVRRDVEWIAESYQSLSGRFPRDAARLGEFIQRARQDAVQDPQAPVRFRPSLEASLRVEHRDKTAEILSAAQELIRIPSVTGSAHERIEEVRRAATWVYDYIRGAGLEVRYFDREKYPSLLIGFPGQLLAPVMLSGHLDVVEPEPDDRQFEPRIEGDYLWGRGAADMKTVVATYLAWFKDTRRGGEPFPPVSLLLVGNEENGESEPAGTPYVLETLAREAGGYAPSLFIAGERTGERGNELWGEICTQNRGVLRIEISGRGQRAHSSGAVGSADLARRLLQVHSEVEEILCRKLILSSTDGWQSQFSFPFFQWGEPGLYNITPDTGLLGIEVRPIPDDDVSSLAAEIEACCRKHGLEVSIPVRQNGIACDPGNPYLKNLVDGVRAVSGKEPPIGRKLPGTSARFAPGGQGVVWGQSGIGPHRADERHFIPSILPYYRALTAFGSRLSGSDPGRFP